MILNWKCIDRNECWLVYLYQDSTFQSNRFYLLMLNNVDGSLSLHNRSSPLPGHLTVVFSWMLYVWFNTHINVEKITNQEKAQARVVFDNFKKIIYIFIVSI